MAQLFDPTTFSHLESLGVSLGSHCWEVGAGGDSVVKWLAERAGATGLVVATDIDTKLLNAINSPRFQVIQHDVQTDDPPSGPFDLVHARLVLVHLNDPLRAINSMVSVLRPGGWILIEDADPMLQPLACLDEGIQAGVLANKIRDGFRTLLQDRGADLGFGRKLPGILRHVGMTDVAADAFFPVSMPGCNVVELTTMAMLGDQLVACGHATSGEISSHLANISSGTMDLVQPPLISAWGKKPLI